MNRQKAAVREMDNKHAQARESYPKNKSLYSEIKSQEKASNNIKGDQNENQKEEK